MAIEKVAVIGSGLMGSGIAQVAAMAGQEVTLIDISDEILAKAKGKIEWSVQKLVEKGQLPDAASVMKRIKLNTSTPKAVSDADFIIEAVFENIDLKKKIAAEVDANAPKKAIMATNTSGLSITAVSDATNRKPNMIGMHWFNPPQLAKMIEVIQSKYTSEETLKATLEMCKLYKKETIRARRDVWYFLSNRSRMGISNEANLIYVMGEADFKVIDAVMKYKFNLPMGEYELADYTGRADNRTEGVKSAEQIVKAYSDFEPWPIFLKIQLFLIKELWGPMKAKGLTGVKVGKGFYEYPGAKWVKPEIDASLANKLDPLEILAPAINEAAWCVTNGVGTVNDIDKSFTMAFGWPKGIFEVADGYGWDKIVSTLNKKQARAPQWLKEYYIVDPLVSSAAKSGLKRS